MQFWERSQEENELTFKILNVSEKSQYGQNLHGLNGEWLSQKMRQPERMRNNVHFLHVKKGNNVQKNAYCMRWKINKFNKVFEIIKCMI